MATKTNKCGAKDPATCPHHGVRSFNGLNEQFLQKKAELTTLQKQILSEGENVDPHLRALYNVTKREVEELELDRDATPKGRKLVAERIAMLKRKAAEAEELGQVQDTIHYENMVKATEEHLAKVDDRVASKERAAEYEKYADKLLTPKAKDSVLIAYHKRALAVFREEFGWHPHRVIEYFEDAEKGTGIGDLWDNGPDSASYKFGYDPYDGRWTVHSQYVSTHTKERLARMQKRLDEARDLSIAEMQDGKRKNK